MNENTRNAFASYGLEILKRSVLLVLYKGTDPYSGSLYPQGRVLTAGQIRERLNLIPPRRVSANTHALVHGILDYLRHDGHAHHYVQSGWAITEKGIKIIER